MLVAREHLAAHSELNLSGVDIQMKRILFAVLAGLAPPLALGANLAIDDLRIVPLHHQVNIWAARKGITYVPRTDERIYAHEFKSP